MITRSQTGVETNTAIDEANQIDKDQIIDEPFENVVRMMEELVPKA